MTARFAGSRTLDERRRRWLASHEVDASVATRSRKSGTESEDSAEAVQVQVSHFPIRKVVSPKGWKIALVGIGTLLLGAALIVAAHLGTARTNSLGPGWKRLFPVDGSGLIRLFQSGVLILSGQIALLVWWVRSRSLRDFDGHYHVWLWAAVTVFLAGMGMVGQWHWAWSDTYCWLSSTDFPQRNVLCWMLPATLAGGVIWKKLRADMRDCRTSYLVFWGVGVCYLGACAFRLKLDHSPWPELTRQLVGTSLQMLTCVGVFISFLTHARFVLHVSVEPPAARPSLWSQLFDRVLAVLKKVPKPRIKFAWKSLLKFPKKSKSASAKPKPHRKNKPAKTQETTAETSQSKREEAQEPEPASKPTSRKTARRKPATSRPKPAEEPQKEMMTSPAIEEPKPKQEQSQPPASKKTDPIESSPPKPATPTKTKPVEPSPDAEAPETSDSSKASEPQLRLDEPLDPEMLKGLSKKERRRMRKLHRDAQRK